MELLNWRSYIIKVRLISYLAIILVEFDLVCQNENFKSNSNIKYNYASYWIDINFKSLFRRREIKQMNKLGERHFKDKCFLNFTYSAKLKEYLLSERRGGIYILNEYLAVIKIFNNQEAYCVNLFDCSDISHPNIDNSLILALQSNCSLIIYNRVLSKKETIYKTRLYNNFSPNNKLYIDENLNFYFLNECNQLIRFPLRNGSINDIKFKISPNVIYALLAEKNSDRIILIQ